MDSFKGVREFELGGNFVSRKLKGSGSVKSSSRGRAEVHVATHGRRLRKHAARIALREAMDEEGYFTFTSEAIAWYCKVMHGLNAMTVLALVATVVRAVAISFAPYVVVSFGQSER